MKYLIYIVIALVLIGAVVLVARAEVQITTVTYDDIRACIGLTTPECLAKADLNNNGTVNTTDLLRLRGILGDPEEFCRKCVGSSSMPCLVIDQNGDGVINAFDQVALRNKLHPAPVVVSKPISSRSGSSRSSVFTPYQMCQIGLFAQSICAKVSPVTSYQDLVK